MRVCATLLSLALFALISAGCASPVCGTWCGSGAASPDNPIAAVTFCHDGTFTANADYGSGKSHAISGCYKMVGDKLTLCMKDEMREYGAKVSGDCLDLTHKDKTQKLCRVKGCASCSKCCAGSAPCTTK
ncbi:MAG TPA: hypothetical protein VJZ71_06055 [Phycisphaerae bacterium]|nr:hypothetical protein [Phycisphaerae bacterium]